MSIQPGIIIESTPDLADTLFANSRILITTYNNDGATGFIINQPFGRALPELEEFKHSAPFPLYNGGPVDTEHLFFIHRRPDLIADGEPIDGITYLGGDFKQAVVAINNKSITEKEIQLFVGYCGWDAGELETEIAEGSWVVSAEPEAS
jgi:putative transcriptional regulator